VLTAAAALDRTCAPAWPARRVVDNEPTVAIGSPTSRRPPAMPSYNGADTVRPVAVLIDSTRCSSAFTTAPGQSTHRSATPAT
jgi:hypothetical protein